MSSSQTTPTVTWIVFLGDKLDVGGLEKSDVDILLKWRQITEYNSLN